MINLLPQENKKQFFREYTMRLAIVGLIFTLLLEIGIVLAFAPSYAAIAARVDEGQSKLAQLKANSPEEALSAEASIAQIKNDIARLRGTDQGIDWSHVFTELVRSKPRGIGIFGVDYEVLNNVPQIQLRGYAEDRDALSVFRKMLTENTLFKTAEFPPSAFLKERDIEFTMRITLRVPQKP